MHRSIVALICTCLLLKSNHHASPAFLLNVMESLEIAHTAAGLRAPAVCEFTATGEAHAPKYSGIPKKGPGSR
jgi:hypothetical protein